MIFRFRYRDESYGATTTSTILARGEAALDTDTGAIKLGDGATPFGDLPPLALSINGGQA